MLLSTPTRSTATLPARPPLSRSTTVCPLLTPNNTFGVKARIGEQRQIQATLVLSRIARRNSLQQSKTVHSTPRGHSEESGDYFDRKIPGKGDVKRVGLGNCATEKSHREAQQGNECSREDLLKAKIILASTYFSFPDFENISHFHEVCTQHHGQLHFNSQQVTA